MAADYPFAHLHVHTEYSLLDGMSRIKDAVSYAVELGMSSLAITDHGAMYGVVEFYDACKKAGIKPIIGVETYLAPRGMEDRDPQLDRDYKHLLLLAQNQTGYQNLLKIASESQLRGYYYKPRIDKAFLAAHSEGVICTTGCLAAPIPQLLMKNRPEEAMEELRWYLDVFGEDRFFVELQEHDIQELRHVNSQLMDRVSPYANLKYMATNDVHYVRQEDAEPHDVLLCIGTSSLISDKQRMRFSDASYHMRSQREMWDIFGEIPESLTNTVEVAEMCEVDLDDRSYKLPKFPVPDDFTAESYLRHLCEQGLVWRFGERASSSEVQERLNHELRIIHDKGFDDYFLIVWDLCEFSRRADIWWNVRGSGAGSLVAYSLGITHIDPLQNDLLFERFLNPFRTNMPDVDLDYPDDRRAEMIQYCVDRYGEEKVAQIITFGTLGARAALRDVARTMDVPLNEVDEVVRTVPNIPGKPVSIEQALEEVPEFAAYYGDANRPHIRRLIDTAKKLEGVSRHASTHAAGVLIADKPLVEYVPLNRPTKSDGDSPLGSVSQWPMEVVDAMGLLKVDFLGLRTLTVMRKACDLIEQYHGIKFDLNTIPHRHMELDEDGAEDYNARLDQAFDVLMRGNTAGVFQVEGGGMTRTLTEMRPSRFEHIIAAISLYRPGPLEYIPSYIRRMHKEEDITYHHPYLEPILAETFGIIVYQEQIMRIASDLFGYSMGEADLMRRAVAKKKEKELVKHRDIFRDKGPERGVDLDAAEQIFADIEFFARYGFNKSHAADYAVLTVQTAYLKAHFPHEYMTALLSLERDNTEKIGRYISECRQRLHIDLLPPNLNYSGHDFTIEEQSDGSRSIRFGLDAIKNVGTGAVEAILKARGDQPFTDVADLCQRVDMRQVGKRALEGLIRVGALDEFAERPQLLASIDRMVGVSTSVHKAADIGQMSLFGEATGVEVYSNTQDLLESNYESVLPREMSKWERELVGVTVSQHPVERLIQHYNINVKTYISDLTDDDHDRQISILGMVVDLRTLVTKKGDDMAIATVEDASGILKVVVFPRTWQETIDLWELDSILLISGKLDTERDMSLLVDSATQNLEQVEAIGWEDEDDIPFEEPIWEPPVSDYDSEDEPPFDPDAAYAARPPSDEDYPEQQADNDHQEGDSALPAPPVEVLSEPSAELPAPAPDEQFTHHIRITLRQTRDSEQDKRLMQRIHGELISVIGGDSFEIVLIRSGRRVSLAFEETTDYRRVRGFLSRIKGVEIEVEERAPIAAPEASAAAGK
ncbi:MAG: DNA polymerase III subunit alpha [Chloroflexi bacterium]|nr:DNA polymerase III subunit alpha [Chloroflexota bacterium]